MEFEFKNERKRRIFEFLREIDEKIGSIYYGALVVLEDKSNPQRISQSAHSFREIACVISRSSSKPRDKEEALPKKLSEVLDPRGGAHNLLDIYRVWNKYQRRFANISHHGEEMSDEEFITFVEKFEEYLIENVLVSKKVRLEEIDKFIKNKEKDIKKLKTLISVGYTTYSYFFNNADQDYLEFLYGNNFFKDVPKAKSDGQYISFPLWPESRYLVRAAIGKPEIVMDIIKSLVLSKDSNPRVLEDFTEAAINMPTTITARIVDKIKKENWIESPYHLALPIKFNDLLAKLIKDKEYKNAVKLVATILKVRLKKNPTESDYALSNKEAEGYIEDYDYGRILETILKIPDCDLKPFLKTLMNILGDSIELELKSNKFNSKDKLNDASYLWRPSIEESEDNWNFRDVKEKLVGCLRELLERYMTYAMGKEKIDLNKELEGIVAYNPGYLIFKRFKLHMYRLFKNSFKPQIENALIRYFDYWPIKREYILLVKESFGEINKKVKNRYFELIKKGPKEKEKDVEDWKIRKYILVKKYLSKVQLNELNKLLGDKPEPQISEYLVKSGFTFVGPNSPINREDMISKNINEIIRYLLDWEPNKDIYAPTSEGLGRVLEQVVEEKTEDFSYKSDKFLDLKMKPVYIYHLFNGFRNGLKKDSNIDWDKVINLAYTIIKRAKNEELIEFKSDNDDFEINWDGVFKSIADLLKDGLVRNKLAPILKHRTDIFEIIEFLCNHPEPDIDYERQYGGDNLDPFTMSINTVRGTAFHALFSYIIWCNNLLKDNSNKTIFDEAKKILNDHLDCNIEPTLTIHSVYGYYFPLLHFYDYKWAKENISKIFPKDDLGKRYSAWETYLSNNIYYDIFKLLEDRYEWAIDELSSVPERRYWIDPVTKLINHLMIIYFNHSEDSICRKFFSKATDNQKGMAVSFIGRYYIYNKKSEVEEIQDIDRFKEFWEWRLIGSNSIDELKEFGWWIKKDIFDNEWLLKRLHETLLKTKSIISAEIEVIEELLKFVDEYPLQTSEVLYFMIKSKNPEMHYMILEGTVKKLITKLNSCKIEEVKKTTEKTVDYLISLGFEDFKDIY